MFWSKEKISNQSDNGTINIPIREKELSELFSALSRKSSLRNTNIPKESPLFPLFELLLQIENQQQQSSEKALLDINSRVGRITSIASIRDMIKVIEDQTGDVSNLAAQAEEMSAAATEMASATNNAANFVGESLDTASKGVQKVKEAITLVDRSFSDFEQTNQQVHVVLKYMGEIEEIIGLIAGVADQTNLLALNAAIEAARAGEQGKGFAVVADEVRKLAEDTKSSVGIIRDKISVLNLESQKTAQSISQVVKNMEEGKTRLQHAETSIEQILHNIHTIAGDIRQIAAGNDEQSSTLQSFGQTITGFAGSAENTLSFARDAGQGIYRISEELIDLRQKRIQLASGLSLKQLLEIYKTDHLCWTWKIYNMLLGYETLNASDLETSDTCELGKLLHNKGWHTKGDTKQFVSVHDQVHTLYKEAVAAHLNKNYSQINVIWDQLLTATNRLTFEIDKIIRECTD